MSHLHIPDGVLPPLLWAPALGLALLLVVIAGRRLGDEPRRLGFQAALGGLMLAVMSIPIPLFAFEYCLTLAGPVGVLLGAAAGFQTVFVVSLILALLGQGGLTVVGLNALVMGAGAAIARPAFVVARRRLAVAPALAVATVATQVVSGALWFALIALLVRLKPGASIFESGPASRAALLGGVALALWAVAIVVEAGVAYGVGRFVARVRPDLLPAPHAASAPAGEAA